MFKPSHIIRHSLTVSLVLLLSVTSATAASAPTHAIAKTAKPEGYLGSFGNWQAWQATSNKEQVCYMVLTQKFQSTKKFPRQNAHLMITHRPSEGSTDVVSYNSGYVYQQASEVTAKMGKTSFSMFTDKDTAWARDPRTDHAITRALRGNASISITGHPASKGAKTVTDNLALKGAEQAYRAISTACDVPVEKAAPIAEAKKSVHDTKKPAPHHKKN